MGNKRWGTVFERCKNNIMAYAYSKEQSHLYSYCLWKKIRSVHFRDTVSFSGTYWKSAEKIFRQNILFNKKTGLLNRICLTNHRFYAILDLKQSFLVQLFKQRITSL